MKKTSLHQKYVHEKHPGRRLGAILPALAGLTAILLGASSAHAGQAYRVDVVVFEQHDAAGATAPVYPAPVSLPDDTVNMHSLTTGIDPRFVEQGIQDAALQSAVVSLQQKGYRVLVQRSWTQPALDDTQAKPVMVDGGNAVADAPEVSGWVRITAAEMPQIEAQVSLLINAGQLQHSSDVTISGPERREPLAGLSAPATSGPGIPQVPDTVTPPGDETTQAPMPKYMALRDVRRLKPDTLTYLDHPRIGMLVRFSRAGSLAAP
jgi:hypothetical protein